MLVMFASLADNADVQPRIGWSFDEGYSSLPSPQDVDA